MILSDYLETKSKKIVLIEFLFDANATSKNHFRCKTPVEGITTEQPINTVEKKVFEVKQPASVSAYKRSKVNKQHSMIYTLTGKTHFEDVHRIQDVIR